MLKLAGSRKSEVGSPKPGVLCLNSKALLPASGFGLPTNLTIIS